MGSKTTCMEQAMKGPFTASLSPKTVAPNLLKMLLYMYEVMCPNSASTVRKATRGCSAST